MLKKYAFLLLLSLLFLGCEENYTPKPKGYFRIDLPANEWQLFNPKVCPFEYEYSKISKITKSRDNQNEPCWMNIFYPTLNSTIHLSYKNITNGDVNRLIEDARTLVYKHTVKASDIQENLIINDSEKVYGLMYELEGNAASSVQFYLTDSVNHFVRGALYYNAVPNPDSIAPVQAYIRRDITHFIESFKWK